MLFTKGIKRSGWLRREGHQHPPFSSHPSRSPAQDSLVATAALKVDEGFLGQVAPALCTVLAPGKGGAGFRGPCGRACVGLS